MRTARATLGLSQAQAAKAWKISLGAIHDWEQSRREPRGLYRERIERILRRIEKD
jgi:DNA-binding transcriptional regulator YiaG